MTSDNLKMGGFWKLSWVEAKIFAREPMGFIGAFVAIMAFYREGGILKRLRATPLSPVTILGAHVVVKL